MASWEVSDPSDDSAWEYYHTECLHSSSTHSSNNSDMFSESDNHDDDDDDDDSDNDVLGPLPEENVMATPEKREILGKWGLLNTPLTYKEDNSQKFGFDDKHAGSRNERFAEEGKEFVLGPMPVLSFLEAFLPDPGVSRKRKAMLSFKNAFKKVPSDVEHESEIYRFLVRDGVLFTVHME
ncbi:hypothetical protein A0H81_08698 [Grifola frondosa]|uniref:Uncharacterized protein n=1 Tax=Grifola frondosa TaxID=5627 RepID=A0A1C7M4F4_GRIFR|nr:hypothetical protein A0H81_08698 [Grifola frondosa]